MGKRDFTRALARFLVCNQAGKSIDLEMGKEYAKEWSELRATTPLSGYPNLDEAEEQLLAWLGLAE